MYTCLLNIHVLNWFSFKLLVIKFNIKSFQKRVDILSKRINCLLLEY